MSCKVLVVGAGFAGSVVARQLADAGCLIDLIDRRKHIAGNAYDHTDAHGVLVHAYGPHIFHTNSVRIVRWLSRFTDWRFYEHRVLAEVNGVQYPFPINQTTINLLYGLKLDETGVSKFLEKVREQRAEIKTSEDLVLSSVGRDLCEKFFRGYTRKQWGVDLSALATSVAARIPTRTTTDDRYFTDTFQLMPSAGYARMFERMLDSPMIRFRPGCDYAELGSTDGYHHIVYTGAIDAYFNYCFGPLPYRSLRFEHLHLPDISRFQPTGTVNYPNQHAYTRITEFKHLTGQLHDGTSIVKEYPQAEGDPYYPVPSVDNTLIERYQSLARECRDVSFVGRLAQYRYYNMDQVVGAALKTASTIMAQLGLNPAPSSTED